MAEVDANREAHGKAQFDIEKPPKSGGKKRNNTATKNLARQK